MRVPRVSRNSHARGGCRDHNCVATTEIGHSQTERGYSQDDSGLLAMSTRTCVPVYGGDLMSQATSSAGGDNARATVSPAADVGLDELEMAYRKRLAEAYTDDVTWLAMGKRLLEGTLPALNDQANRLGTSVGWFWTVYSTTTAVATVATSSTGRGANWMLVAPVFTALLAYLLAVVAQNPVHDEVDLRSPDAIRTVVQRSVQKKRCRIHACILMLVVTAVLIGAGVVCQLG